ncbi:MAG: type II toxin-antitoxin system HicA family toxin [Longimicrobiales bacterium]
MPAPGAGAQLIAARASRAFRLISTGDILNAKQRRTLEAAFAEPPPSDLRWRDAASLLRALGAELSEGRGSRVRVALRGRRAVFHRPHPRPEMDRGAIRDLRELLRETGFEP